MRVTFDTNVLVSAFIAKQGNPANLLELALALEDVELVLSKQILRELKEVLGRREVRKRFTYTERDVSRIVSILEKSTRVVMIKSQFHVVKDDPKDDIVLATAYDGKARYIVSGDHHLLRLGTFRGIKIVNPKKMLGIIAGKFPELISPFET